MKLEKYPLISSLLLILLLTVLTIIMRLAEFFAPLDRDGGVFAYMGSRILAGDLPYWDIWDHKTPAIYYLNALALSLFGYTVTSFRYMEIIFAVSTAWVIYRLGYKLLCNRWAAAVAALSFTATSNSYIFSSNSDLLFTETFFQLPIVMGIAFATQYRVSKKSTALFLTGLMGGWAILFKPPGGFFLIAVALWIIHLTWREQNFGAGILRCGVNLAVGLACPLILTITYFALRGGLADLYSQTILYNSLYVSANLQQNSFQSSILHLLYWAGPLGFVLIPATIGLIWGQHSSQYYYLIILWFVVDLGGSILSGRFYPHYFLQVLPSLALLAGMGWLTLKNRYWHRFHRITFISLTSASLLILLVMQFSFTYAWITFRLNNNLSTAEQAAKFITANTNEEESIYVWGAETAVYFLSKRKSASRYTYLYPLLAQGYSSTHQVSELLRDIEIQRPRYIIDTHSTNELIPPLKDKMPLPEANLLYSEDNLDPVRLLVAHQYYSSITIGDWLIYERIDSPK